MNKLKKYFLLLSFLCCLFGQMNSAFCVEEKEPEVSAGQEQGGGFYASSAECSNGLAEVIIGSLVVYIAGKNFILPGLITLIFGSPTPLEKAMATAKILIGTGMITGAVISMSTSYQCFFSFVRDPVVYKNDDISAGMLDEEGKEVTDRWKAAKAVYSDNINICARGIPPFVGFYTKAAFGISIKDYSCYNTNEKWRENNIYDGSKAFLCPEEWRFHGYKSEIKEDTDDKNKKEKFATKGNGLPDGEDSSVSRSKKEEVYSHILDTKRYAGPLECRNGKVNEELNIHGFKYKIVRQGPKICAILRGLGDLPSISGAFVIGCHYAKPDEAEPLCDKSVPIYAMKSNGDFVIDLITNDKIRLDWDNSACFSCFIDSSCQGTGASHSRAVMPVSSYVMECLHQTLQNVILGCKNVTTGVNNQGMLARANSKFKNITYIAITLAVILFAFKILFTNNLPKVNEILIFVIKIGVILYCTQGEGEKNGLQWLYKQISGLSSGISALALRAASYQTETTIDHPDNADNSETATLAKRTAALCRFADDLYIIPPKSGSLSRNLDFLKPYDMLDCRLFFYLGGALAGYDSASSTGGVDMKKIAGNAALAILNIVFPLFALFDPIAFICGVFLLLFAFLMIGIAVWLLSLLAISMIVLFFIILIAPLVLPMMLFGYTKSAFENWTKELIAYTLFPPLLFLFFGIMMAVFDTRMFGDTKFVPVNVKIGTREALHFAYEKINCTTSSSNPICKKCKDLFEDMKNCDGCDPTSLACKIRTTEPKKSTTGWKQETLQPDKRPREFVNLLESIGFIIMMAVIFCTMINTVAFLLAELVGKVRSIYEIIGHGISPMTGFMKMSKFTIGIPVKNTKKFFGTLNTARKNRKPKPAGGSAGTKE